MRIAIDIRGLARPNQSGVGEYTLELLRAIFNIGSEHDFVLLSTGTELARRHALDNLARIDMDKHRAHVRHVHHLTPNKSLNLNIVTRGEPKLDDLVQKAADVCDVFWFPNLNFIATRQIPSVVTIHDLSFRLFPQFFTAKDRAWHQAVRPENTIKNAQVVITPSECTRADAIKELGADASKTKVIPHGIDHSVYHPKPDPSDHGIRSQLKLPNRYLLFIATIEPRKNIHVILDAFESIQKEHQDLHLVMAGGPGWKSTDIIDRMEQMSGVQYLGYVNPEHKPVLYRGAEAFIFPSIYEGFGLPVLEAMASGTPVVTSHTSSLPEITGDAAILINPHNAADLTAALTELIHSSPLQSDLAQKGLARATEYTWAKAAQSTLDILTKVKY